ncbi:MAG: hypothetical protein NVSMB9_16810 [Isosphaeraceae bacterium]
MRNRPEFIAILLLLGTTLPSANAAVRDATAIRARLDAAAAAALPGGLAPGVDDATFLRRLWLDVAGHVPPPLVARDFLDDHDPQKRAKMVDRLLASDEYAEHWGRILAGWLTSERPIARPTYDGRILHETLRDGLRRGEPYGRLVRDLLAGSGTSDASGSANFLLRYEADPPRLAGAVGKNLLGVTIQCAQCHDHPFASWKQNDFWGLAASFARLRRMESNGEDNLKAVVEARRGELMRPDPNPAPPPEKKPDGSPGDPTPPKQIAVKPRLLDGTPIRADGRREALADWVVSRDNPYFARNTVSRLWEQLTGQPLVRNLDKPVANPATGAVLNLLADEFKASGQDVKHILKVILLSKTYSQTSSALVKPAWARPTPRPLSVDQLHASLTQATGHAGASDKEADKPEPDTDGDGDAENPSEADAHDVAANEKDPETPEPSPSLSEGDKEKAQKDASDKPEAKDPDENPQGNEEEEPADRPTELLGPRALTLQRALVLLNGTYLQEAAQSAARVSRAGYGNKNGSGQLDWAFLATLSRRPSAREKTILGKLIKESTGPKGLEDAFWVLLNSAEFQTNH